jgi:hypothetical protein
MIFDVTTEMYAPLSQKKIENVQRHARSNLIIDSSNWEKYL